jgi:hypothetical protein
MDSKVWQRAVADLNPPGVPSSFRHAKSQQNIASVLLRRERGGGRQHKAARALGNDKEENFWAESESASKVCTLLCGRPARRHGHCADRLMCVLLLSIAPEPVL